MRRQGWAGLAIGMMIGLSAIPPAFGARTPEGVEDKASKKLDYSATAIFTSDYVFRGVSLSDEHFAVQGYMDVKSSTGLYLGGFASNVQLVEGDGATAELDAYAGYAGKFTKRAGYNLNVTYSTFPGAKRDLHYNNVEYTPSLSYEVGPVYLHGGVSWSPNYFAHSGDSFYYDGNVEVFFVHDISAVLHGGRQTVEHNDRFFAPDYNDWAVTLRKKLAGFTGSVSYTDTDLEKEECFGGGDICDGRVVFAVQRSL